MCKHSHKCHRDSVAVVLQIIFRSTRLGRLLRWQCNAPTIAKIYRRLCPRDKTTRNAVGPTATQHMSTLWKHGVRVGFPHNRAGQLVCVSGNCVQTIRLFWAISPGELTYESHVFDGTRKPRRSCKFWSLGELGKAETSCHAVEACRNGSNPAIRVQQNTARCTTAVAGAVGIVCGTEKAITSL